MASRSIRPLRICAGGWIPSSTHCSAGLGVQRVLGRRRGRIPALVPSAACARWNRWARSASSSCRARGERVEHRRRHAAKRAALQLGVVLDADPRQRGHLTAAQPLDAALTDLGQAGLRGRDLGSPRGQELADLGSVVHAFDGTSFAGSLGCTVSTPSISNSHAARNEGYLEAGHPGGPISP